MISSCLGLLAAGSECPVIFPDGRLRARIVSSVALEEFPCRELDELIADSEFPRTCSAFQWAAQCRTSGCSASSRVQAANHSLWYRDLKNCLVFERPV